MVKRLLLLIPALTLLANFAFAMPKVSSQSVNKEQIRAVFLFNLVHFVTWPREAMANSDAFVITVLGDKKFGEVVRAVVEGESKDLTLPIRVNNLENFEDIGSQPCHILYIDGHLLKEWREKILCCPEHAVLTVSNSKGFPEQGGVVNLLTTGNRFAIEINLRAAQNAGLQISAKLIRLARLVDNYR